MTTHHYEIDDFASRDGLGVLRGTAANCAEKPTVGGVTRPSSVGDNVPGDLGSGSGKSP